MVYKKWILYLWQPFR